MGLNCDGWNDGVIKVQVCVRSHYRELYRFPLHATELLTAGQLATGASVESSLESPRHYRLRWRVAPGVQLQRAITGSVTTGLRLAMCSVFSNLFRPI